MVIQFHSKTVYICKLKLAKGENYGRYDRRTENLFRIKENC